jgi:hypothetical protein
MNVNCFRYSTIVNNGNNCHSNDSYSAFDHFGHNHHSNVRQRDKCNHCNGIFSIQYHTWKHYDW